MQIINLHFEERKRHICCHSQNLAINQSLVDENSVEVETSSATCSELVIPIGAHYTGKGEKALFDLL